MPMKRTNSALDLMRAAVERSHSRLFADGLMKEQQWERHRNALWRHRPEPVVCMRVASGFVWQLLAIVVLSVAVGLYGTYLEPLGAPRIADLNLLDFFPTLTFALSLLLVFKTNSSYSRWWEGRTAWGRLITVSQNLVRLGSAYFDPAADGEALQALARWTAAAGWACKLFAEPGTDLRPYLQALLEPAELEWLLHYPGNKALAATQVLTAAVAASHAPPQLKHAMDQEIAAHVLNWGAIVRIHGTAIPCAYTRHTSRFLMSYLFLAPLALWPVCGWVTPVLAALEAFMLIGTENIGAQIEDPSAVLPIDAFCQVIERDAINLAVPAQSPLQQHWAWLPSDGGGGGRAQGAAGQGLAGVGDTGAAASRAAAHHAWWHEPPASSSAYAHGGVGPVGVNSAASGTSSSGAAYDGHNAHGSGAGCRAT